MPTKMTWFPWRHKFMRARLFNMCEFNQSMVGGYFLSKNLCPNFSNTSWKILTKYLLWGFSNWSPSTARNFKVCWSHLACSSDMHISLLDLKIHFSLSPYMFIITIIIIIIISIIIILPCMFMQEYWACGQASISSLTLYQVFPTFKNKLHKSTEVKYLKESLGPLAGWSDTLIVLTGPV